MRRRLWVSTALAASMLLLTSGGGAVAQAPGERVSETADDLDWLEPAEGDRALAWARERSAAARATLSREPGYEEILGELRTALSSSAPVTDVALMGSRAVRLKRDVDYPKGRLQTADRRPDGTLGEWRTVLDVAAFAAREGKAYTLNWSYGSSCLPSAHSRCLLGFSDGGGDDLMLREFDLETGEFIDGGFTAPAGRVQSAWIDADTVLIAHASEGDPKTAAGWAATARLWRRGQALSDAPVVFTAPATDATFQFTRIGSAPRVLMTRVIDYSTFEVYAVGADGVASRLPLPTTLKPFGPLGGTNRHAVFQLSETTEIGGRSISAESIVAYDFDPATPEADRLQLVHTPTPGQVVSSYGGFPSTRSRVFFPVQADLAVTVMAARYEVGGWIVEPVESAPAGIDLSVTATDSGGEDIVMRRAGFLQPAALDLVSSKGIRRLEEAHAVFDASAYEVEIRTARSSDGVAVDYYLVRPRQSDTSAKGVPTLITGYGAFGIALPPAYLGRAFGGEALKLWFDRGGALAVAAIRGGGERGQAWHRAALRERRQVSYDDFIAVSQDLVTSGFTRPDRLGVFGTSNGGLLSATVAVQRPDLYGAAVSDAPLADMLRYDKIAMGAAWKDEYGDPADSTIRTALAAYSPVHNIRRDGHYPPFLISVSTTDNRVGPAHARKLAWRLLEAGDEVYLIEDEQGGHGVSDPLVRPDLMALRMQFLISRLMRP